MTEPALAPITGGQPCSSGTQGLDTPSLHVQGALGHRMVQRPLQQYDTPSLLRAQGDHASWLPVRPQDTALSPTPIKNRFTFRSGAVRGQEVLAAQVLPLVLLAVARGDPQRSAADPPPWQKARLLGLLFPPAVPWPLPQTQKTLCRRRGSRARLPGKRLYLSVTEWPLCGQLCRRHSGPGFFG